MLHHLASVFLLYQAVLALVWSAFLLDDGLVLGEDVPFVEFDGSACLSSFIDPQELAVEWLSWAECTGAPENLSFVDGQKGPSNPDEALLRDGILFLTGHRKSRCSEDFLVRTGKIRVQLKGPSPIIFFPLVSWGCQGFQDDVNHLCQPLTECLDVYRTNVTRAMATIDNETMTFGYLSSEGKTLYQSVCPNGKVLSFCDSCDSLDPEYCPIDYNCTTDPDDKCMQLFDGTVDSAMTAWFAIYCGDWKIGETKTIEFSFDGIATDGEVYCQRKRFVLTAVEDGTSTPRSSLRASARRPGWWATFGTLASLWSLG